ncbi:MAG: hypothetical protein A2958_02530 [Candidatus Levybacteria bacterium RIFCSPLOWO2_01_FULL_38_13]|nr:MAG: hypothetical protein A2629_02950 [Candidatus Levybacteria bacterium RIFCSPHIGHO2_01_FULL_41_15]OGH35214.1 MAG: hypothetical protein A2958_02530 [Candidatus Levybacteria bacterium RIFCSPLOWO2_01_FULL_38_13]
MEVALLNQNTIKIKGKSASFLVDPVLKTPKTGADAVIFLKEFEDSGQAAIRAQDARVIIKGGGEYEVGGVRISGTKVNGHFNYFFNVDNVNVFIGRTSGIEKTQEGTICNLLILNVDSDFKESMVTAYEPNVILLLGNRAEQAVNLLAKDHETSSKFVITSDKLPTETQIVLLK